MEAHDRLRVEQLRAASTAFLRLRPAVVACGVAANAALLAATDAPRWQLLLVATTFAIGLSAFTIEALVLRRRLVSERWLTISLLATLATLAFAAACTGGMASPLLPVLAAPVVVALAAFGRSRRARLVLGAAVMIAAVLLLMPPVGPVPAAAGRIAAVSWLVALALFWLAIVGLGDAHVRTAAALDAMRRGAIVEAAARAREAEALGAKVAHEIRNPLTSIKALVQLAAAAPASAREGERMRVALSEIDRVEHTLSEYLSLARPLTDVAPEPVDLVALLRELALVLEARAAESGVTIALEIAATRVFADPRRLREALTNLCSNAIEAMPRGGVLTLASASDATSVHLRVHDQGVGMTHEAAATAGEPFRSGREGGTGLGLALARSVARMHGGDLSIASTPGRGTTITVSLPTGGDHGKDPARR
ncbi:MAG: HAMP domain-containing histidine kinase [Deltaproteobacteria bacterium]|nr:HAMP domain-containing histidine kinase [Deltaproteobacteria bacterium]MBK8715823.1 HAMP domain-containing histidine kinase [Deltaproteobacteria bacterium]MBP7292418.1 HAMP domain-containing histidine kinase [Nannocystaceae bacterium]